MRDDGESSPRPFHRLSENLMSRQKEVMLSEEEHRALTDFKQAEYPEGVPFGYIIGQLLEDAESE